MTLRRRFCYSTELRAFAARVEALELASRRDPEAPIVEKLDLARAMRDRAAEVMRHDDPLERGALTPGMVFSTRGRPARVEVRRIRARA